MNSSAAHVGWFWFRANFGRRWTNYLMIVLLVGGTKHGQSADITRARALHAEYKARKRTERRHISRTDNATSVRRKG